MNNFNFNQAGARNGSNDHPRLSNVSSASRSRSMYGFHEFTTNEAAHSFVNTALNSGNGYRGGIAAAFEVPHPSTLHGARLNGTNFNGGLPGSLNSVVPSPAQGFFSAMNPIGLHPHPRQNQVLPQPDSVMLLLASVDEPLSSSGQTRQSQQRNGSQSLGVLDGSLTRNSEPSLSPFPSNASQASSHHSHSSLSSYHSSASSHHSPNSLLPCDCEYCRRCVCHMYCSHHAEIRCPVHGQGRPSGESNASGSSDVPQLSGNGSSGSGSQHGRFSSNGSQSSSHSRDSWASFDSEFSRSPVHSESCRCDICQFCICNMGGMFTNCVARCAKHGMVRLY